MINKIEELITYIFIEVSTSNVYKDRVYAQI